MSDQKSSEDPPHFCRYLLIQKCHSKRPAAIFKLVLQIILISRFLVKRQYRGDRLFCLAHDPALRFRVIYERNAMKSMEMSFFALPSQQGPVQGRFKPTHRPISLSTRVAACVRRFETPTALNYGRTESKKDISMLFSALSFLGDLEGSTTW